MIIDATIIVQLLNFCVVWLLLYTLVLKPGFILLEQQMASRTALQQSCSEKRKIIQLLDDKRHDMWQQLHLYYRHKAHAILTTCQEKQHAIRTSPSQSTREDPSIDNLIAHLSNAIVDRLSENKEQV